MVQVVQNTMSSSPPRNRRRIVGLNDPRAARAQANDAELHRLALRQLVEQDDNLDIPSEEYEGSDYSGSDDAPPPPAPVRQSAPIIQAQVAAPRSRHLWTGNNTKLNLLARKYINQPLRQEVAANASGSADRIAEIRSLKRDPSRDLDFDNLAHAGKLFLVQKTCEELNECAEFRNHIPENFNLSVELTRQKIKEYTEIAVATPEHSIDHSNEISRLILFSY
jgi:hypothetical protein